MASSIGLTADAFNQLLDWLDPDRERAARSYEHIRARLIRVFTFRGCSAPEELADETIDRVAGKVAQITQGYVGDPALYFYGVAEKIYLEHSRKPSVLLPRKPLVEAKEIELKYACLEQCMERLSRQNRELILAYYAADGNSKIGLRKQLAARLGLGANALWIRAHRIRELLRKCVKQRYRRMEPDVHINFEGTQ